MKRETEKTKTAVLKQTNWLRVLLFAATIIIGALYIWQVNISATRGFAMRDLDQEIESLETDNDRLQMEVTRLQSIDSVTTRVQMLGLVEIDAIDYVNTLSSVAINR
ncbi:MAG: hypothetical protein ABH826_01425 [Patescibacteria group bacterium]|nr:hypothetical protein [Patescibacteria group bacterium]